MILNVLIEFWHGIHVEPDDQPASCPCHEHIRLGNITGAGLDDLDVNIGNIYVRKGLLDTAIGEYQKSIQSDPSCLEAHINLASAYGLKEDYDKTLYHLKKAIELDPHNPDVHYNLGVTYFSLGLFEDALAEYEKVLAVMPHDKDALHNRELIKSHFYRGK